MKTRTKVLGFLIALGGLSGTMQAQWTVWDPGVDASILKDIAQAKQIYNEANQTRMSITNIESAFKSGNWRSVMGTITGLTQNWQMIGNGRDQAALQSIIRAIRLANSAMQDGDGAIGVPNTQNAMQMTQIALAQLEATLHAEQLNTHLQYVTDRTQYQATDQGMVNISQLSSWKVKQ